MAFGGWIWLERGPESGMAYLTGFFVEWSLSLDNVFAISMIFTYFAVPRMYQHRVLFWGIVGVVVMRGVMIAAGAALVAQFQWILYVFGAFLFATGVKMLVMADREGSLSDNPVLRFLRKRMRVSDELDGERFFVTRPDPATGKAVRFATPLFLCLVLVEAVDLIFAVDSVPAIFAITTDPYLVYTSNIFAILGLRSLYFALAAMIHRFRYLKYALAAILLLVGTKIFLVGFGVKIPAAISLSATAGLIAAGIAYSLWRTSGEADTKPAAASSGR
jgi:tellurite resistance protein TerC